MISREEVLKAQQAWGEAIVNIGAAMEDRKNCEAITDTVIDTLYAYDLGPVLFNPTKAAAVQFRLSRAGARSYFIGGNNDFDEDLGFALNPWTAVRFETAEIILEENRAIAMGNYFFTDNSGSETKVEFTFGYKRDGNGNLRIDLHHSSLPYVKP